MEFNNISFFWSLKLDFPPAIAQTLEHFRKLPKHTYTRPEEADVTSLLNFNFDFVDFCVKINDI
jgi:hypothetical protein